MKNKQQFSLPAVGISSLVVIFAALCLAVFAQLAISTAKADEKLSDQGHQAIIDYYQAEREADTIIALLRLTGWTGGTGDPRGNGFLRVVDTQGLHSGKPFLIGGAAGDIFASLYLIPFTLQAGK